MADEKKQAEMEKEVRVAKMLKQEWGFPREKKLVKTMIYESLSHSVSSLFRHPDSASAASDHLPSPPPPPGRPEKRSKKAIPQKNRP